MTQKSSSILILAQTYHAISNSVKWSRIYPCSDFWGEVFPTLDNAITIPAGEKSLCCDLRPHRKYWMQCQFDLNCVRLHVKYKQGSDVQAVEPIISYRAVAVVNLFLTVIYCCIPIYFVIITFHLSTTCQFVSCGYFTHLRWVAEVLGRKFHPGTSTGKSHFSDKCRCLLL